MKLHIGETIKQLRREKELTQEELSIVLGVSTQSVSRWELGACYPDMELLPVIADYFGITVDRLLGVDNAAEQKKVQAYLDRFQQAISVGDSDTCIQVAREGVAEYPNNYALLNKLMYALFLAADDDGNHPNWKENMQKYDAEITSLGERIMKYCPDPDIRYEATIRLAFNHCEMGRKEQGRTIYEALPSAYDSRELQIWWALDKEERLENARELMRIGHHFMYNGLWKIIGRKLLPDDQMETIFQKFEELYRFVYEGPIEHNGWATPREHVNYAAFCARTGRTEEAIQRLKLAVEAAYAFENRPESGVIHSFLLGDETWHRSDFETSDTRPLHEILRDKWLADSDFDAIRNTEAFGEILSDLG